MNHSKRTAAIVLLIGLVSGIGAYGQQATLTDKQVTERLAFITSALEAGQPRARTWLSGWLAGYSAGAATMGILAATTWKSGDMPLPEGGNDSAQDMLVGSGTFALGVVGLLIDPFTPATAAKKLRALPETSTAERQAKLVRAEELLRECARRERSGRSLTTHLLNAGVNAAAGVVTVAAFDRPFADGLVTFAIGEAVSLLNIFTQPMRATRDLKRYEAGYPAAAAVPRATWSLSVRPGGLSFRLQF
jgi:hypothetical protein